ncbi:hypothetical protein ABVK25_012171 [Lepraria finkii]|uniref:Uncharacterized protein n=1 Tax=Lepraria finkii TaxID=1340010 RepID=A0ABR4AIT3_9LECA
MPQESWEEALYGVGDVVLPQDFEPDKEAILEESIERLETHDGGNSWDSEAPSIMGSTFYSDEDQGFQAPTPTHAEDEGHVPGVTDGIKVLVKFVLRKGRNWVDQEDLSIDPSDLSWVERVAEEYTRNRRFLFNTTLRSIAPSECFEAVVGDGTNVVLLIPEGSVNIDDELLTSARRLGINAEGIGGNTIR